MICVAVSANAAVVAGVHGHEIANGNDGRRLVSAEIQAGQIRKQLAEQSLSLANQMPALLLQLFK